MAFQSVPDTAEAFLSFGQGGQVIGFTMFYRFAGGYTLTNLEDLAGAIESTVAGVLAFCVNQCVHFGVNVRGLEFENDFEVTDVTGAGIGAQASGALPNQNCLAVKRLSGQTGRSARGRIFTVGLYQGAIATDENFVVQSYADDWVAALEAMDAAAFLEGWQPVIVSRFTDGAKRPVGVVFPIINWAVTGLRIDSRRDRMP